MSVSEHHGDEEVTTQKRRCVNCHQTAAGVLSGITGPPEVAQAVAELGRQFGFIKILNPARVILWLAPLKFPDSFSKCAITSFCVAQPGEGACFHRVKV